MNPTSLRLWPVIALAAILGNLTASSARSGEALDDFVKTVTLNETGQTADLIAAGEKFLANHAGSPGEDLVLLFLGQAHHKQKQYDESIEVLSKLLEDHSESELVTDAAMQRGESYRLSNQNEKMIPDFQQAYEGYRKAQNEDAAHAQFHIVQGYNFLKKTDKAKAEAELLMKNYPTSNYARNAAQLMKLKSPAAAPQGLAAGTEAPDIEMELLEGGATKKLSEFEGKIVVLDFWASWCGPCQEPMAKMQAFREKYPDWGDKVELIALSIDNTIEAASGHLEKNGWDNTLNAWAGEGGFRAKAPTAYQVRGIPTVYVIGPDGKVAATGNPNPDTPNYVDVPEIVGGLLKKKG